MVGDKEGDDGAVGGNGEGTCEFGEDLVEGIGKAIFGLGGGFVAKYKVVGLGEEGFYGVVPLGFVWDECEALAVVFVQIGACCAGNIEVIGSDLARVVGFGFIAGDHLLWGIRFDCFGEGEATLTAFG